MNNPLFDTHIHLNSDKLKNDVELHIKEANEANVKYMNVIGYDIPSSEYALELATKNDHIYATVGIHPCDVKDIKDSDYDILENLIKHPKTIAIGELGFDFYWDTTTKEEQEKALDKQLELAIKYQKPIVVHIRDAMEQSYLKLKSVASKLNGGVIHCFSGSPEMAKKFTDLGFYISLAGPVTFKNARVPKEVAKSVPLDKILIETDAPYLTPHPFRGKLNSSKHLHLVAKEIANLKELSYEEVVKQTTQNAFNLFGDNIQ